MGGAVGAEAGVGGAFLPVEIFGDFSKIVVIVFVIAFDKSVLVEWRGLGDELKKIFFNFLLKIYQIRLNAKWVSDTSSALVTVSS